jgi:hypothetical protein
MVLTSNIRALNEHFRQLNTNFAINNMDNKIQYGKTNYNLATHQV